jgi:hypothetical protein
MTFIMQYFPGSYNEQAYFTNFWFSIPFRILFPKKLKNSVSSSADQVSYPHKIIIIVVKISSAEAYNEKVLPDGFLVAILEVCVKFEDYLKHSKISEDRTARPTSKRITAAI